MPEWTNEQKRAIYTRNTNLLVAAGAGAGKTAVLVERLTTLVTDQDNPVDIDRLLVVTFTNAAAAEMRERVGTALTEQLRQAPGSEHLLKQISLLGKSSITTLHSFCLDVLRQYFYLVDLDPSFRIADENEAALLRVDVVESVLEEHYREPDDIFGTLVDGFGGKHDDILLAELVLQLSDYAYSNPRPEQWLRNLVYMFSPGDQDDGLAPFFAELRSMVKLQLELAQVSLTRALGLAHEADGPGHYIPALESELEQLESAIPALAEPWDKLRDTVAGVSFSRLPGGKRKGDPALRDEAKQHRDKAKDILRQKLSPLLFQSEKELLEGVTITLPLVDRLVALTLEFMESYHQAKQAKGLVDFSDLEHYCLSIITTEDGQPTSVGDELRQKYVEVLIDEYQDINAVQESILGIVARGDNSFMVGDVKQSIYRFRLADPSLFLAKYQAFGQSTPGQAIDLAHNFRSRKEIIEMVNFVFGKIMTRSSGEMEYDDAAELKAGAKYPAPSHPGPSAELIILDKDQEPEEDSQDALQMSDAVSREARAIADKIEELVKGGQHTVYDPRQGENRPLRYSDMVVLLRANQGWADGFLEAFRTIGIPAFAETNSGYFTATEVSTMISLLRVVDNPHQDIPLAAVLRSPIVGLSGAELSEISLLRTESSFFAAVEVAAGADGPLAEKLGGFLRQLAGWRKKSRRGSLPALIWQIFMDTGYHLFVGATPGGKQRQANLNALYDRACEYEKTSFRGLFRFLRFIERIQESQGDLGTARAMGETEDVVRIMTIHKSKGLEFPVVFLAGMGKRFNLMDLNRSVLIHKSMGLGPFAVNVDLRNRYPTLQRLAVSNRLLREALAEELRVLYVAMTRARERLYMVGSVSGVDEHISSWRQVAESNSGQKALPDAMLLAARSYLDWLGPTLFTQTEQSPVLSLVTYNAKGTMEHEPLKLNIDPQELDTSELSPFAREVYRRLGWKYSWLDITSRAVKVSVSELKRRQSEEDLPSLPFLPQAPPAFLVESKDLSRAQVGSAVHLVLQQMDLAKGDDLGYLEWLVSDLVERQLLSVPEAKAINLNMLVNFFSTTIGNRLQNADSVWRELPFSVLLPADTVHSVATKDERVLVQGVIDCLFAEGQRMVLLDFKTDRSLRLLRGYNAQLSIYSQAVAQLLRREVDEGYLCFLELGSVLPVQLSASKGREV